MINFKGIHNAMAFEPQKKGQYNHLQATFSNEYIRDLDYFKPLIDDFPHPTADSGDILDIQIKDATANKKTELIINSHKVKSTPENLEIFDAVINGLREISQTPNEDFFKDQDLIDDAFEISTKNNNISNEKSQDFFNKPFEIKTVKKVANKMKSTLKKSFDILVKYN